MVRGWGMAMEWGLESKAFRMGIYSRISAPCFSFKELGVQFTKALKRINAQYDDKYIYIYIYILNRRASGQ